MNKTIITALAAILPLVSCTNRSPQAGEPALCREVIAVEGEHPSLLPADKKFKLIWNDEFNGSALDESKWYYRTDFWMRRAHWYAAPEDNAVELRDGLAYLKIVKLPDGRYVTPQLQTSHLIWDYQHEDAERSTVWPVKKLLPAKFKHAFGYYECRCRLQQMPGWWSAFWMQSESIGVSPDPRYAGIEHDIMESFDPGFIIRSCYHYNGYGDDHVEFSSPRSVGGKKAPRQEVDKEVFHTFGLLWEKDGYTPYLDGVARGPKVGCEGDEAVSWIPEFILLTTEARWFRKNNGTGPAHPELEAAYQAGDAFIVDYVRVFDIAQ